MALKLGQLPRQIQRILLSSGEYAEEHVGIMLRLAVELDVWDAGSKAIRVPPPGADPLTPAELRAFERAAMSRAWNPVLRAAVLERGVRQARERLELAESGVAARQGMTFRRWIEIGRELCDERGN
ncbi:MAG TPA: hypothetical protein VFR48_09445 [Solirubrobacteraceae bacterium]|nr:hypothetical protein [Solirubrobacteraceae bacterium]